MLSLTLLYSPQSETPIPTPTPAAMYPKIPFHFHRGRNHKSRQKIKKHTYASLIRQRSLLLKPLDLERKRLVGLSSRD